jgi:hypothetical protein
VRCPLAQMGRTWSQMVGTWSQMVGTWFSAYMYLWRCIIVYCGLLCRAGLRSLQSLRRVVGLIISKQTIILAQVRGRSRFYFGYLAVQCNKASDADCIVEECGEVRATWEDGGEALAALPSHQLRLRNSPQPPPNFHFDARALLC